MTPPEIAVRAAPLGDLPFVSRDGYLPDPVARRKVGDGDVSLTLRADEPVVYLRLEWPWSKVPCIEVVRVLAPHRRLGAPLGWPESWTPCRPSRGRPSG